VSNGLQQAVPWSNLLVIPCFYLHPGWSKYRAAAVRRAHRKRRGKNKLRFSQGL